MINEHDYPPSPAYYRQHGADCRDHVTPEYWRDSAFVHLFRAGRKDGECVAEALTNAFLCLALWFRSMRLRVPFYSDALNAYRRRLNDRNIYDMLEIEDPIIGAADLGPFFVDASGSGRPHWITIYTKSDSDDPRDSHLHNVSADSPLEAVAALAPWLLEQYLDAECEREALRAENARLREELDALRAPLESDTPTTVNEYTGDTSVAPGPCPVAAVLRPTSPTLDTPATSADEWTNDELEAWVTAKHDPPRVTDQGRKIWDWHNDAVAYSLVHDHSGWHGHAIEWLGHHFGKSATEAARILGATKPADPFAELLTIETDEGLAKWLDEHYVARFVDTTLGIRRWSLSNDGPVAMYDPHSPMAGCGIRIPWLVIAQVSQGFTARDAARTLHRILTGGAP